MVKKQEILPLTGEFIEEFSFDIWKLAKSKIASNSNTDFLYKLVKRIGGRIEKFHFHVNADDLSGNIKIYANKRFIINLPLSSSAQRRNFTIAHELGHFFLHTEFTDEQADSLENFIIFKQGGPSERENQANKFAVALLMPKAIFLEQCKKLDNNPYFLSAYFDVDTQVIDLRMNDLKS